jgi:redox-sensitive bicupin YhaK (pirin superfamily)
MREVERIVEARRHRAGTGLVGRRVMPSPEIECAPPFSLVEEIGPTDGDCGDQAVAAAEPQRGVEVITVLVSGALQYSYSSGDRGVLQQDDVLWTVAGAGTEYSERVVRSPGSDPWPVHALRFSVDLPAPLEGSAPRSVKIPADRIPWLPVSGVAARARVLAGQAFDVRAVIETGAEIEAQEWLIDAGADVTIPLSEELAAMAYVITETVWLGDQGLGVRQGQLALLGRGTAVRLCGPAATLRPARLMLLAGRLGKRRP